MKLGASVNWYKYDSKFSIELLKAFVKKVESQIDSGILDYSKNKKKEFVVEDEENKIGSLIEYYGGLEDQTWDLDELFKIHFPNLQRKSALLTLYAFLEHELDKLSNKLSRDYSFLVQLTDIHGRGVHRAFVYMQKVAGLKISFDSGAWKKIRDINRLRNLIIHNDGQLNNSNGTPREEIKIIREMPQYLSGESEVIIASGFLEYALDCFDEFFRYIDKEINEKYSK